MSRPLGHAPTCPTPRPLGSSTWTRDGSGALRKSRPPTPLTPGASQPRLSPRAEMIGAGP